MLKTKIVCTLGPSSNSTDMIEKMIKAGMNVARLNFSHGTHEEHAEVIRRIKEVREQMGVPLAIMLDTKGPEIRLCKFEGGSAALEAGETFTLTTEEITGDKTRGQITYNRLPEQMQKGMTILLDDGNIELQVESTTNTEIRCTVMNSGIIKNGKGVNVPGVHIEMPHLSEKDKGDLLFGIQHEVDFIAASFIRNKDDIIGMRKFVDYNGGHRI